MPHLDCDHVRQLDLFRTASPRPDWWKLPAEARERVLRLITRVCYASKGTGDSLSARRNERSPKRTTLDRHSSFTDLTQRSE